MTSEQYPKVYLYKRIVQAKLFIDANYADKIDVDKISDEACFSKYHFIRLFKKAYGKTPHQYLTTVRIEKAIIMFQAGNPITDVCHAVGFETLSSFGSLFKTSLANPLPYFWKNSSSEKCMSIALHCILCRVALYINLGGTKNSYSIIARQTSSGNQWAINQ